MSEDQVFTMKTDNSSAVPFHDFRRFMLDNKGKGLVFAFFLSLLSQPPLRGCDVLWSRIGVKNPPVQLGVSKKDFSIWQRKPPVLN
jgi:hypothetical protein